MQQDDSTRTFDTVQGTKNYAELNDLIADPYRRVLNAVLDRKYDHTPVDSDLLREFHREFVGEVMPGIAGEWRMEPVQVGNHTPPPPWDIEYMMRETMEN